jgi:hypothetical protein
MTEITIYICNVCDSPCIFLRPPIIGEFGNNCWQGQKIVVNNPEKR